MRAAGFLLLMIGFGLRLDTSWQATAGVLLAIGAAASLVGLVRESARAFVPDADRE